MMDTSTVILITFVAVISGAALAFLTFRRRLSVLADKLDKSSKRVAGLELEVARKAAEAESRRELLAQTRENYDTTLKNLKESHAKAIETLKENQDRQMESVVAHMKAETEKILKQREEELSDGNKNTMDDILKPLKSSIEDMRKAMKENEESHIKNTTELSQQLKNAVEDMKKETTNIGSKADTLSEALTGKPKVQGCFGENFLESILNNENLVKGLHYTREDVNDDRTRPDFVFHFKDGLEEKDLIVDSKVSLTAFVNYMNAGTEEERQTALNEHYRSVRKHIDELASKEYAKKNAKSFADYVLMFMPRDMAFRVALEKDPMIWQYAYGKNVLITTEQTIIPFIKIIQLTWNKYQHDTNIIEITKAAENMIERVGAFYDSYKDLGKKLNAVTREYNSGIIKLRDGGASITTSARQVMKIGVKREKNKEFSIPSDEVGLIPEE